MKTKAAKQQPLATSPRSFPPKPVEIGKAQEVKTGRAPASQWTGTLTFGLISLPVKLYTGPRSDKSLSFHRLHDACHGSLNQQMVCKACDVTVHTENILSGYEFAKGQFVIVDKDELKAFEPESSKVLDVGEFYPASQIDPILYEESYFLSPQDGGHRAFHLFRQAMRKADVVGITKMTTHGREHLVAIRPFGEGMVVSKLYYSNEAKAFEFPAQTETITESQVKLATQVIAAMTAETPFELGQYQDTYAANVRGLLDARVSGKEVVTPTVKARVPSPTNIEDALTASLAAAKAAKRKAA